MNTEERRSNPLPSPVAVPGNGGGYGRGPIIISTAVLALSYLSGCQTLAGNTLAPIEPAAPSFVPTVEHAVGEFSFTMGGGEPKPSTLDGKLLSNEIMEAWKERGYVREEKFVPKGESFSGTADYQLTLSGSQHNDSSFWIQVLNALTLMWFPYTVTHDYELQYVLEDVRQGKRYSASIRAADRTQVEIFLLLTLPIAHRGHSETVRRMADHLYEQFLNQGAFAAAGETGTF